MNVLFFSPGFPAEMPLFARGLAAVGARVHGIGDQPEGALPADAREALSSYLRISSWSDEQAVIREVREWMRGKSVDRIECLWEPHMILAARLREVLGVPGMTVEQTVPFRDKEVMKQRIEAAGLRVPRHARATTVKEAWAGVEKVGYPAIVKPISGAGSKDTHRCNDKGEFERALGLTRHVAELSVEEYIDGDELTFDTICAGGQVLYHSVAWYLPKPMVLAHNPWISMQNIVLRDPNHEFSRPGVTLGLGVLRALGFETGFTHMEWYRKPDGEAVFGEIGGRPAGARLVHAMNYACDMDLFRGWASAVCHGVLGQPLTRKYNASMVFKRAVGHGRVVRYEGLDALMARHGAHVANCELTPIGQPRRDPSQVVVGDGWIVVRHEDLQRTREMSEAFARELRIVAGSEP